MLEHEMPVQQHCLEAREDRDIPILVGPARLNHADDRIREKMDGLL